MKNIVFLSLALAAYCVILFLLVRKVRDIFCNPEKYEDAQLEREGDALETQKRRLPLFKSLSHQYSMVGFLFVFALTAIDYFLLLGIQRLLCDGEMIFLGASLSGIIALFFLNIFVGMGLLPLSIKRPFFEVATRDLFNTIGRLSVYKRTYISVSICFALTFPFAVLSADHYCGYDDEKIMYSAYFQLTERTFRYEEIDAVKAYIWYNNSGNVDTFHYEIICGDTVININNPNMGTKLFTEETYAIHRYIEQKGSCSIELGPLSEEGLRFIAEELSDREREIAESIFSGFQR